MSFQWTVIAGFLYFEMGLVLIMLLPIFTPRHWRQFFNSRILSLFHSRASTYFYVMLGILFLFLTDAIRDMRKHSPSDSSRTHLSSEMKNNVKMFRAQRNFYITGFALFLLFIIRRIIGMLIIQDDLTLKAENILREAESTVKLAKSTVFATTMQCIDTRHYEEMKELLKATDDLLHEEKLKADVLIDEALKWKSKYEEAVGQSNEKGDK